MCAAIDYLDRSAYPSRKHVEKTITKGAQVTKVSLLLLILHCTALTFGQDQQLLVGEVDLYGYAGLDLNQIRPSLPVREGDKLSVDGMEQTIVRLTQEIKQATGHETNVAPVCCDERGNLMVYIGLWGKSSHNIPYNPSPQSSKRLPANIVNLYQQTTDLLMEAVQKEPREDDSKGYALSLYPPLRAKHLAMREYAINHELLLRSVLESSSEVEQRRVAAHLLGYSRQSKKQIAALVRASRDPDDTVRNNAVRALGALASSSARVAAQIPASGFIEMLNSGVWTDRNKVGNLLTILSETRDPKLLGRLRLQALDSLIEMARWRSGHASNARTLLGRIAGIEENRLQQLVDARQVEVIINELQQAR